MSACPACTDAEADPGHAIYMLGCHECQARALAHSPQHDESRRAGKMLPAYRQALARVAGTTDTEVCDALHQRVKLWASRIAEARTAA